MVAIGGVWVAIGGNRWQWDEERKNELVLFAFASAPMEADEEANKLLQTNSPPTQMNQMTNLELPRVNKFFTGEKRKF